MKISRQAIQSASLDDATTMLVTAGGSLQGKNLRRASWREIAQALGRQRTADHLFGRLQAAKTRDDALRVLRLARKWNRIKHKSTARRSTLPGTSTVSGRQVRDAYDAEYLVETARYYLYDNDDHYDDYYRYLFDDRGTDEIAETLGEIVPSSTLQQRIVHYAFERRQRAGERQITIRDHLQEDVYWNLVTTLGGRAIQLSEEEEHFFSKHALTELRRLADGHPYRTKVEIAIASGYALYGLLLLQEKGRSQVPCRIDWANVVTWLVEKTAQPADDESSVVISVFYYVASHAPKSAITSLMMQAERMQQDWLPLLGYLVPRLSQPLPQAASGYQMLPLRGLAWEDVLAAGASSHLFLDNLRHNLADLAAPSLGIAAAYVPGAMTLLTAGAGTLRSMNFPEYTLTCRAAVSLVGLETLGGMLDVAYTLARWHDDLERSAVSAVVTLIADTYQPGGRTLPAAAIAALAQALERHVVAYVLLKEVVFKEQLGAAPFRIRKKHVRRFWDEQQTGTAASLPLPASIAVLQTDYAINLVIEGLVHACLDYLYEPWPLVPDGELMLKEEVTFALRMLALVYAFEAPWLLGALQPTEADLDRAPELADFLVKQIIHAPLELAQALVLSPEQGLPLLAGGQMTPLERAGRRVLAEAAGARSLNTSEAPARVFRCRPISKRAALERGKLGGDCSSHSVPFRALSPHHVYYGIFDGETQIRGYMTVFEAWAEQEDGWKAPVLCLETVNVPIPAFDAVQNDLLLIFDAIAQQQGLFPRIVLITQQGTWNYHNGEMLRQSRRFRQGTPVTLAPADAIVWSLYRRLAAEARYYSCFEPYYSGTQPFRILAPYDERLDRLNPENVAEAERIRALPPRKLAITIKTKEGPAGFISQWPSK